MRKTRTITCTCGKQMSSSAVGGHAQVCKPRLEHMKTLMECKDDIRKEILHSNSEKVAIKYGVSSTIIEQIAHGTYKIPSHSHHLQSWTSSHVARAAKAMNAKIIEPTRYVLRGEEVLQAIKTQGEENTRLKEQVASLATKVSQLETKLTESEISNAEAMRATAAARQMTQKLLAQEIEVGYIHQAKQ